MLNQQWCLSKVNIRDVKTIQPDHVGLKALHTKAEWEHWLRSFKSLCNGLTYWVNNVYYENTNGDAGEERPRSLSGKVLAGYQLLDMPSSIPALTRAAAGSSDHGLPVLKGTGKTACLHVYANLDVLAGYEPEQDRASETMRMIEETASETMRMTEETAAEPSMLTEAEALLEMLTAYAFETLGIYRLVWNLSSDGLPFWQSALEAGGWQSKGFTRRGLYEAKTRRHHDVYAYMLCAPEYDAFGTAFVLFKKGLLSVSGTKHAVLAASLTHFGQSFSHEREQETADWLDLLDQQGKVLEESALKKIFKEKRWRCPDQTPEPVKDAAMQAAAYFLGERQNFSLSLDLPGTTDFQRSVLTLLADIPYGETCTYGELARMIYPDDPGAEKKWSRAVGHACGANPLPLFIPCHRVIGRDGKLTGFSSGLDIKEYLLAHEIMGLT